jgi:hypothetical protein
MRDVTVGVICNQCIPSHAYASRVYLPSNAFQVMYMKIMLLQVMHTSNEYASTVSASNASASKA